MVKAIVFFSLLGCFSAAAFTYQGNAVFATDGSASDVQAAINASSNGCTVTIPAGSFTWTSGVTINGKGIRLQGQGSGRVIGRSPTAVAVGTGSKTFTTQSGLSITNGQPLIIQRTGGAISAGRPTGAVPWMQGTVSSYAGTSLVMNITSTNSTGTHPLWIISTMPATTIMDAVNGNMLNITENTATNVDVSGFKLFWGAVAAESFGFLLNGINGGKPIRIHDCYLTTDQMGNNGTVIRAQVSRGIVWNCSFVGYPWNESAQPIVIYASAFNAWTNKSTMGTNDVTGTSNFYVEDCDFHAVLNSTDMDDNTKLVARHNLFNNAGCATHGADTSNIGVRHYEFYDNTFLFNAYNDGSTLNLSYFFFLRGGTGVFTDNAIPDISSTDFGNKPEMTMIVMNLRRNSGPNPCWGANVNGVQYPAPRQVGMGRVTGTGVDGAGRSTDLFTYVGDSEPVYIWNNTGTTPIPAITDDSTFPGACTNFDTSVDYIVAGRDYITGTAKPGYAKYAYPHPLRSPAGGGTGNQPPVVAASASPTNGAAPLTVSFSSAGSVDPEGTALTYNWTFGDGGTSSAANPSHIYQTNASYSARLSVSDGTNTTLSSLVNIVVTASNRPPVAVASASPTNGVAPLTVSFSSVGSVDPEGTALTYNWTFGDGGTSTAANPSHTYQAAAAYAARLSVSDGTNTTLSSLVNIVVTASNRPPVAVASASPTNGVAPLNVSFSSAGSSDPEGTALTYNWTFGDGGTSAAANPSHSYLAAGSYAARLTVSDGTNTASSSTLTLTATGTGPGSYGTPFPLTETSISEGGRWINGKTVGLDWADVATTPGLAFGTETGTGGYDDSTALLTGTWGPNQSASARVHVGTRAGGGVFREVELRLRSSLSAHNCTGYEVLFSLDSGSAAYTQIVRWNGPLGNFTLLDARGGAQYQINEGDEVKAVISGNTITSYIRGVQVLQVTDGTYTSGSPGIGFYLQGAGTNDSGFTYFTATDGTGTASNQPPIVVASATPTSGTVPLTVAFSSTGSFDPEGATLTYSWTFGDGATSTVPNPSHTYSGSGYHTAWLTVSDGTNSATSSNLLVTAKPAPPTNLRALGP